jgi:predicted AlkP superfamily phosphohydrolase/phosphomutase
MPLALARRHRGGVEIVVGFSRPLAAPALRVAVVAGLLVAAAPASHAYIGPGAGFAFASSLFVLLTTFLIALAALLVWPFRKLARLIRHGRGPRPRIRRLIVVGLDGQDPELTRRFMDEGKLPNFRRLAERGSFRPLKTTFPSVSPVAWSSFSTGTNPGRHNIYDFLDRDLRTYLPQLSSTRIGRVERFLRFGSFRIPLDKPELRLMRKSKPFWSILGEHRVWSTVLRVPITFPPDRFYGAQLSAMCVPDLLGTQGTFLLFTTRPSSDRFKEGGIRVPIELSNGKVVTRIAGPENVFREGEPPVELPLTIEPRAGGARLSLDGEKLELETGRLSDWIELPFPAAPGVRVRGLCRMKLLEAGEHVSLYVTPLNIDPAKPAMPISHPSYYATYLAKRIGNFATLGLAEDTWSLNEGVVDDDTFLELTWDIDRERQQMFFAALDRLRRGTLVCVFDATDRIQHMFWRYLEKGHPADREDASPEHRGAIEQLYRRNDDFVGRVMKRMKKGDVLMVLSDHGFTSFRRGVNLNAWLLANGYLVLRDDADGGEEWLRGVDWSRTRAYALGLTGVFLNVEGREAHGVVKPGAEVGALKEELARKLGGLRDDERDGTAINEVFDTHEIYRGPYVSAAPDLLIGYNRGYRVSWDCASGVVRGPVIEDNVKAWSGDHCVDPRLVPGVLFCSHRVDSEDPALIDVAPTALELFGIRPPGHMDGKPLFDMSLFDAAAGGAEK